MKIADGVWPVMITPYTPDDKIDYEAVDKLLEWYDEQGVAGVFAVCQSSEMFELSAKERYELTKFIVEHAPAQMGVIASGHVAEKVDDQIREAQSMIDLGIQSYVFISNQFANPEESDDVARNRIEYLINHIEAESFGIYECPVPYKRLISPELLKWCEETEKFSFLKDTCCNLNQLKEKCEAVKGSDLKIFNANAATLLESLQMGCAGYSGVMANFHPDLYVWLVEHYKNEPEKAKELMDFLGAASMTECQLYPVNSKYHMCLEGVDMNLYSRRQDYRLLTESKKLEIDELHAITKSFKKSFYGKEYILG